MWGCENVEMWRCENVKMGFCQDNNQAMAAKFLN